MNLQKEQNPLDQICIFGGLFWQDIQDKRLYLNSKRKNQIHAPTKSLSPKQYNEEKNHDSFGLFNLENLRKIFTILLLKRKWCSGSTSVSEAESGGSIPLFLDHHNKKCKNLHFFCFVAIMGNENFIHSVYKNANYGFNHDSTIPSSSSTSSSKR